MSALPPAKGPVLYALCLFAGIAGIELGLSLVANVTPVCFVEQDKFCQDILRKRHPNAWIWDDVTTFPAEDWAGVDLLTAGFPCQPWSYAGSRAGTEDDRWLWARIVEVIRLSRPRIVLLLTGGLGHVLADLAALGVAAEWGVFSCENMGAPQKRDRVFVLPATRGKHPIVGVGLADSNGQRLEERTLPEGVDELPPSVGSLPKLGELSRREAGRDNHRGPDISVWPPLSGENWSAIPPEFWPTESGIRQLASRLPTRLERSLRRARLKALGNSVSPPVVAAAWLELGRRLGL